MMGLWKRRLEDERRPGLADQRRAARFQPEVAALEGRQLQTVSGVTVIAEPDILVPPNGRFMTVQVKGTTSSFTEATTPTTYPEEPKVSFQVTDEYRRVEPKGPVGLTLDKTYGFKVNGKPYNAAIYKYSFTLELPAQRSQRDPDGRQYSVLVAADDRDNGQGTTVPVLVPVDQAGAQAARHNQAARAKLVKMIRALPPLVGSNVNSASFWQRLGFG